MPDDINVLSSSQAGDDSQASSEEVLPDPPPAPNGVGTPADGAEVLPPPPPEPEPPALPSQGESTSPSPISPEPSNLPEVSSEPAPTFPPTAPTVPLAGTALPPLAPPPPPPKSPVFAPPPLPQEPEGPGALERIRSILRPIAILGFFAFIIVAAFYLLRTNLACLPYAGQFFGSCQRNVTLTYWGIWEDNSLMAPLLADFVKNYEAENPNVNLTINYEERTFSTLSQYKDTLQTRLQEKTGPDILRLHNSWVGALSNQLAPLPSSTLSETDYAKRFYPSALTSAKVGTGIYALPLEYDGLVLFYNKKLLAGVDVTKELSTWEGFRRQAVRLTQWGGNDPKKKILQAGAAIGAANNISHSSDLLSLLLAQSGLDPLTQLTQPAAADALTFYTNFSTIDHVWDETLPFSVNAFANGQVAMIFAPSWRALEIKNLNPQLEFAAVPVPQLSSATGGGTQWASFWMEAVNKNSAAPDVAWKLLEFLSQEKEEQAFFSAAAKVRAFGEPYSNKSLAGGLKDDPLLGPLLASAPSAVTGKTTDFSGNDAYVAAFKQAVSDVLAGKSAADALKTAQATINQLEGK